MSLKMCRTSCRWINIFKDVTPGSADHIISCCSNLSLAMYLQYPTLLLPASCAGCWCYQFSAQITRGKFINFAQSSFIISCRKKVDMCPILHPGAWYSSTWYRYMYPALYLYAFRKEICELLNNPLSTFPLFIANNSIAFRPFWNSVDTLFLTMR